MSDDRQMTRLEIEWESLSLAEREAVCQIYAEDFGPDADFYLDLRNAPEVAEPYLDRARANAAL